MRIQLADALENRWMRGEHSRQPIRKKPVRRLLGIRRDERRPFGKRGNLHQGALETLRIARELHPRGIREALALARHRRLQNTPGQQPDITQHHDREAQRHQPARVAAVTRRDLQDHAPDQPDHEQPEYPPHELYVEAHVPVQDMTELVPDDSLQLIPAETIERALRDGDRRICRTMASGECIDAGLLLEHIHLGHRHARGDRHLLHDIEKPLPLQVRCIARYRDATQRARHDATAAAQLHGFVKTGETQHPHDQQGAKNYLLGVGPRVIQRAQTVADAAAGKKSKQHEIERQRDSQQREDEREDQPARLTPRGCLA